MNGIFSDRKIFLFSDKEQKELFPGENYFTNLIFERPLDCSLIQDFTLFFDSLDYPLILVDFQRIKYETDLKVFFRWLKKTSKKLILLVKQEDLNLIYEKNVSPSAFVVLPSEKSFLFKFFGSILKKSTDITITHMEIKNVQLLSKYLPQEMEDFIGNSTSIYSMKKQLLEIAPSELSILLLGENGTGKTHLAKLIHENSSRKEKKFVVINMAEIPEELAESEFFGTIEGAFTGAINKKGYFDEADGGTLFLDEIGELPLQLQSKLLRVLETGKYRPVGSMKEKSCNIRFICATNKNLSKMCKNNTFRMDLFYRIADFTFNIEPLRNRITDIKLFSEKFLFKSGKTLSMEALEKMENYDWPGNVRQLNKCIKRAKILCNDEEISADEIIF